MDKSQIALKGTGPIKSAIFDRGLAPWTGLPLLRHVPLWKARVSLQSYDSKPTVVGLTESEFPLGILQEGNALYVVSSAQIHGGDGYATLGYYLRETVSADRPKVVRPVELARTTYTCTPGKFVLDNIWDESGNVPTAVIEHCGGPIGYNGSFVIEYDRIDAIDLRSKEKRTVVNEGRNPDLLILNDKTLIEVTVPTSRVPALIEDKKAEALEAVFNRDDLARIAEIGRRKEMAHRKDCWGNSSCIDPETFELVSLEGYPKYKISMDSKGKIYTAERVFQ